MRENLQLYDCQFPAAGLRTAALICRFNKRGVCMTFGPLVFQSTLLTHSLCVCVTV